MKRFLKCDTCGEKIMIKLNQKNILRAAVKCEHCEKINSISTNKHPKRPYLRRLISFIAMSVYIFIPWILFFWFPQVWKLPPLLILICFLLAMSIMVSMNFLKALLCYEKVSDDSEE